MPCRSARTFDTGALPDAAQHGGDAQLAAAAAQVCARLARRSTPPADRCLAAAERAWQAANDNPIFTYGSIPG
ncbi:MAG: hypothetical protein U0521_28420 [Anaerolineae bacterium]